MKHTLCVIFYFIGKNFTAHKKITWEGSEGETQKFRGYKVSMGQLLAYKEGRKQAPAAHVQLMHVCWL